MKYGCLSGYTGITLSIHWSVCLFVYPIMAFHCSHRPLYYRIMAFQCSHRPFYYRIMVFQCSHRPLYYRIMAFQCSHQSLYYRIMAFQCSHQSFYYRIMAFQKKSDAHCVCLILDTEGLSEPFKGKAGYHFPTKYTEEPKGMECFPAIFSYPMASNYPDMQVNIVLFVIYKTIL